MDQFEKALACKTLAPLRHELFEKGKRAEIGEVREWKGQKVRKTANGWVPVTDGKQKSNKEETSTETKEQPQDLATLARSASDAALKVAAQGPNEEVRIAAKRELERRKSEGSDVFEAPKREDSSQHEDFKTEKPSKTEKDPGQPIKDMYKADGYLVSVASCWHWLEEMDWASMSDSDYIDTIQDIDGSLSTGLIKSRYLKVLKAMQKMTREKAYNYIKDMVKDVSEMEDFDIIDKERSADSIEKVTSKSTPSKDPSSREGVEVDSQYPKGSEEVVKFLKKNLESSMDSITIKKSKTYGFVVSSPEVILSKDITSLDNNGMFKWEEVGHFVCSGCTSLTSLEGAPEKVGGNFVCSSCTSLTSLTGAPKEVGGYFSCSDCTSLTSLTGAPKEVKSDFYCFDCTSLTSLEGAPKEVGGGFDCSGCTSLTSLTGAPKEVGDRFDCYNCTSLTSLEGAPKEVKGRFVCSGCTSLTSLEGAPKEVGRSFNCSNCTSLTSLTGAPKEVKGSFNCSSCTSLTSLTGAPEKVGGNFDCYNVGKAFKPSEIKKICNVGGKISLK